VLRLAGEFGVSGFVRNDTAGVWIEVQGASRSIEAFGDALLDAAAVGYPPLMEISGCQRVEIPVLEDEAGFGIVQSDSQGKATTAVTPDMAVCAACLAELREPGDFRYRYPFITCTNCGPRYSIIKTIPYDRPNTTMAPFALCPRCRGQYEDVGNRRLRQRFVKYGWTPADVPLEFVVESWPEGQF